MKKLLAYSSIFALALSSYGANGVVVQSGAWTDAATWGSTSTPPTSVDVLSFKTNNLTLTVDTDATVNTKISFYDTVVQTQNIVVNADKTLTMASADSLDSWLASVANFSGDGTVVFSSGLNVIKGTYVFDSKLQVLNSDLAFKTNKTSMTLNNITKFSSVSFQIGSTLNLNSTLTVGRFNAWHIDSILNTSKGSVLNASGAFSITNGNLNGTITNTGANWASSSEEAYTISLGRRDGTANITLGEFADISSTSTSNASARTRIRQCNLIVNSAANSFRTKSEFMLTATTITMNTSNVFNGGGKTSQAETRFIIGKDNKLDATKVSNAKFILNAANDFGTFEFVRTNESEVVSNSYVTFDLSKSVVGENPFCTIGKLLIFDSDSKLDSGVAYLQLDSLVDYTFKINDISTLVYTAIDGEDILQTSNIVYKDGDSYANAFLIKDTNGGYWVNSSVPEPSTVATIIGALALAFAVYRRR